MPWRIREVYHQLSVVKLLHTLISMQKLHHCNFGLHQTHLLSNASSRPHIKAHHNVVQKFLILASPTFRSELGCIFKYVIIIVSSLQQKVKYGPLFNRYV